MRVSTRVSWGFVAAGLMNILGILIFSKAFTNDYMISLSPNVLSRFGMVCIALWGLAYMAVAKTYPAVPALVFVFAIEKALYVASWVAWMVSHGSEISTIWAHDPLTASFFAIYGLNDLVFGLFFAWVSLKAWLEKA